MIVKTILIFLIGVLGYSEWLTGTSYLQRPIVLGTLTGLVMGDMQAGIIMGATLELAMIGAVSIGAYDPPDLIPGTIVGVSLAISSGAGPEAALTLGIPIATVFLAIDTAIGQPLLLIFTHKCDRDVEKGNIRAFTIDMIIAGYIQDIFGIIFMPFAFYFGADVVSKLLNNIPEFVQTGMDIAAALLPALGFAMLAQQMMNKKVAPFFFVGFFLVAYFGIGTTGVAIFSVLMVLVLIMFGIFKKDNETTAVADTGNDGGDFDEF